MLIKFTVDDTGDSVFHQGLAEMQQLPEFEFRQTQIVESVFLVRFGDRTIDTMGPDFIVGNCSPD